MPYGKQELKRKKMIKSRKGELDPVGSCRIDDFADLFEQLTSRSFGVPKYDPRVQNIPLRP